MRVLRAVVLTNEELTPITSSMLVFSGYWTADSSVKAQVVEFFDELMYPQTRDFWEQVGDWLNGCFEFISDVQEHDAAMLNAAVATVKTLVDNTDMERQ